MKRNFWLIIFKLTASVICFFMMSCAYKLSTSSNTFPGKLQRIQIPLFRNNSTEPGIETYFTNALKTEALKSHIQIENEESNSQGVLTGTIQNIDVYAIEESILESKDSTYMPSETILSTAYKVTAVIDLVLKKKGSSEVLWKGSFTQARNYSAPHITLPGINTSNALYNLSAKRQTLDALSKEMMQEAFDRMLENF